MNDLQKAIMDGIPLAKIAEMEDKGIITHDTAKMLIKEYTMAAKFKYFAEKIGVSPTELYNFVKEMEDGKS